MSSAKKLRHLALIAAIIVANVSGLAAGETIATPRIPYDKAMQIALDRVGGGEIVKMEADFTRGAVATYEVVIMDDSGRHELKIDATTGDITEYETDALRKPGGSSLAGRIKDSHGITPAEALRLALEKSGGGDVVEYDIDLKKAGKMVYEFTIINQNDEYEIEIDTNSGEIVKLERETLD